MASFRVPPQPCVTRFAWAAYDGAADRASRRRFNYYYRHEPYGSEFWIAAKDGNEDRQMDYQNSGAAEPEGGAIPKRSEILQHAEHEYTAKHT